jgi:hypothetical protein
MMQSPAPSQAPKELHSDYAITSRGYPQRTLTSNSDTRYQGFAR